MTTTWMCPGCEAEHDVEYGVVGQRVPPVYYGYAGGSPGEEPELELLGAPEWCPNCGRAVTEQDERDMESAAWAQEAAAWAERRDGWTKADLEED